MNREAILANVREEIREEVAYAIDLASGQTLFVCPVCGGHDDDRQLICEACGGVGLLGDPS